MKTQRTFTAPLADKASTLAFKTRYVLDLSPLCNES